MDKKKRLSDDIAEVLLSQIVVEKNIYQEINFPMKSIYRKN